MASSLEQDDEQQNDAIMATTYSGVEIKRTAEIGNWMLVRTLGTGANGRVWLVRHKKYKNEQAVIKLSLDSGNNDGVRWEAEVLEKLQVAKKSDNVVEYIEKGETLSNNENISFFVCEMVPHTVQETLNAESDCHHSRLKALKLSAQLLKAIFDLHSIGVLHRDLKPENMGITRGVPFGNEPTHVLKLFDLGMARIYTDQGKIREPRSWVGMRGTREWASGRAELQREQSRVDDLWSWFYTTIEWMNAESDLPLPWSERGKLHRGWLKSSYAPVKYLLRNCPRDFYKINAYLRMLRFDECPRYDYICGLIQNSYRQLEENKITNVFPPKVDPTKDKERDLNAKQKERKNVFMFKPSVK